MAIVSKVRLGDLKLHSGGIHHDPSKRVKGIEPIIPRLHEPGQCPSLLGSASSLTAGQMMINCNSLKTDDLRKSKGLHSVSAYGHGPVYRSMPAGVVQSRHAFAGVQ